MSSFNMSHQVLGTAMVTVALLAPAAVSPQEAWAQVLMAVQVVFMTWLVIRRPRSGLLSRLGTAWPARLIDSPRLNPRGVRIAQVLGLGVTVAALIGALLGWTEVSRFLLAIVITSGITNLFLGYCIGCEIADGMQARKAAHQVS